MNVDSGSWLLIGLTLVTAILYSSVGHGGASGYLASMALVGIAPAEMKPTALLLNILVAGIATLRLALAREIQWTLLLPLTIGSIPLAFLGGASKAPDPIYMKILGLVLIVAALRMMWSGTGAGPKRKLHPVLAVLLGAGIGLISGLIGVGGGIFLSPLLILAGWANVRESMGISATFIVLNSLAGFAGLATSMQSIPTRVAWLAPVAVVGALIGTELASRRLGSQVLRGLLAVVLLIAAGKSLLT